MLERHSLIKACRGLWEASGRGKWLLAVSGGADSSALFQCALQGGIPFEVAHCNFNLRGKESLRDRDFVVELCSRHGIILHLKEFDVMAEAFKGESVEMTCRRLRYDFFRSLKYERNLSKIALAHNADDNMETFFLNSLRGSGANGLKGMEEISDDLARPLLPYRKNDIIEFLRSEGQDYVVDSSNLKSGNYRRNFLRNEIFPLLESKWEGFATALSSTIEIQRRESRIINYYISKSLEGIKDLLPWTTIDAFPDAETLIFHFIRPYGGSPAIAHEMALSSKTRLPGKNWRLGAEYSVTFTREGIKLIVSTQNGFMPDIDNYFWSQMESNSDTLEYIKQAPLSELYISCGPENFKWTNAGKEMKIKTLGLKGRQSVWKVLKDAGISLKDRERFPVLVETETGEPVWLPGIKRSGLYLVSPLSSVVFRLGKLF